MTSAFWTECTSSLRVGTFSAIRQINYSNYISKQYINLYVYFVKAVFQIVEKMFLPHMNVFIASKMKIQLT